MVISSTLYADKGAADALHAGRNVRADHLSAGSYDRIVFAHRSDAPHENGHARAAYQIGELLPQYMLGWRERRGQHDRSRVRALRYARELLQRGPCSEQYDSQPVFMRG